MHQSSARICLNTLQGRGEAALHTSPSLGSMLVPLHGGGRHTWLFPCNMSVPPMHPDGLALVDPAFRPWSALLPLLIYDHSLPPCLVCSHPGSLFKRSQKFLWLQSLRQYNPQPSSLCVPTIPPLPPLSPPHTHTGLDPLSPSAGARSSFTLVILPIQSSSLERNL